MTRRSLALVVSSVLVVGCGSAGGSDVPSGSSGDGSTGGSPTAGGSGGTSGGAGVPGSSGHGGAAASGGSSGGSGPGGEGGGGASGSGGASVGGSAGANGGSAGANGGSAGANGGSAGASGAGTSGAGGEAGTTGSSGAGGSGGSSGAAGSGGAVDACAATQMTAEVFGQSPDTLYRVDPTTLAVTTVGQFDCLGTDAVIDIALDKNGQMYGTTFNGFIKIDKTTAHCDPIQIGSYPNSLSFVPAGTVDPVDEALVGYNGSTYVRIDKTTGNVTEIGSLSGGYTSSGDIVSVIGGGAYLTVQGNGCSDCVVEVNPKTGDLVQVLGPAGYGSVFGVAFWAGILYGFTDGGQLFTYDVKTKQSQPVTIPNMPPGLEFYGAGSTTCAPPDKP